MFFSNSYTINVYNFIPYHKPTIDTTFERINVQSHLINISTTNNVVISPIRPKCVCVLIVSLSIVMINHFKITKARWLLKLLRA